MLQPGWLTWVCLLVVCDVRDEAIRIGYTPEQEELRRELRAYFTKLMTPERAEALTSNDGEMGRGNEYRETVAQMGKDGC